MTHKDFTYKELLKESYELTKKHMVFLLGLLAINIIIGGVASNIPLVNQLVSIALSVATTYVMLLIANGHTPTYKDMVHPFQKYHMAWHYFLATLAMYLIFLLGAFIPIIGYSISKVTSNFVAFGISGVVFLGLLFYYGARLGFFGYFVVTNEKMGPIEALKKSFAMTEGRFWKLAGYAAMLLLLNMVGFLALIVGLLVTLPMTWISIALLYKRWSGHMPHASDTHATAHQP